MSKIICDVCGTSYPETASQCPICGCVRRADAQGIAGNTDGTQHGESNAYTYVKGGRFSKSNVKKRTKNAHASSKQSTASRKATAGKQPNSGNRGLVITAIVLLLAIIAVVCYIVVRFFIPTLGNAEAKDTTPVDSTTTSPSTSDTTIAQVGCTELKLDVESFELTAAGESRMLYATVAPENTSDVVTFATSDAAIAMVSNEGRVTAVAPGKAVITVTCGQMTAECQVSCTFEVAPDTTADTTEATTDETTEATTEPADNSFKLNRKDITFSQKGDSWVIYDGSLPVNQITWTSDDETIATIEGGKVAAVGTGVTNVHGEYNGEKASCIIRCSFSDASENPGVGGNGGGISEDGGGASAGNNTGSGYQIYTGYGDAVSDVSIKVGESFTLQLKSDAGEYASVTWAAGDGAVCSVSNNTITGSAAGETTISATYDGVTYSCIVRVRN